MFFYPEPGSRTYVLVSHSTLPGLARSSKCICRRCPFAPTSTPPAHPVTVRKLAELSLTIRKYEKEKRDREQRGTKGGAPKLPRLGSRKQNVVLWPVRSREAAYDPGHDLDDCGSTGNTRQQNGIERFVTVHRGAVEVSRRRWG